MAPRRKNVLVKEGWYQVAGMQRVRGVLMVRPIQMSYVRVLLRSMQLKPMGNCWTERLSPT